MLALILCSEPQFFIMASVETLYLPHLKY